jgi:deoxyribonuclease V
MLVLSWIRKMSHGRGRSMRLKDINPWNLSPVEAVAAQRELVGMVKGGTLPRVGTVLGVDVSYRRTDQTFTACAILLKLPDLSPMDSCCGIGSVTFPYVPGLLSFREIPPLIPILKKAPRPDLIIVDGHGTAHPRGFGLACHLGLITGVPTIGCAKNLLVGTCEKPGLAPGDISPMTYDGDVVGYALRSRKGSKPLYISPGHMLDPEEAVKGVQMCLKGYRLPEPTRLAHKLTQQTKELST